MLSARQSLHRCFAASTSLLLATTAAVHAEDFKLADGDILGQGHTRLVAGVALRTSDPSKPLVGEGLRSDGRAEGGDGADAVDDGNAWNDPPIELRPQLRF